MNTQRALPDDQQKGDVDAQSTELTPYDKAADLSQEFAHIDQKTIGDSTLLCDVTGIHSTKTGGAIAVEVELPGRENESETFTMDRPKVWSSMYEFVRFVEAYGYSSSNFEAMIRDDVEVEVIENTSGPKDYELSVPQSRGQRIKSRGNSIYETIQSYTTFKKDIGILVHLIEVAVLSGFMVLAGNSNTWEGAIVSAMILLGLMGAISHLLFNMLLATAIKD